MIFKRLFFIAILLFAGTVSAVPEIQHWRTDNGARVYFVAAPALPMVDVRVVFDAGGARDGDLPGRAALTNGLLAEGAGGLDADAIAGRFAAVGAEFSNDSLRDMAIVSLRSLTRPKLLERALETFTTVLTRPDFPAAAFERERKRMLVGLRHEQQDPGSVAERTFYNAVYGEHPYAQPPSGTEESVAAIGLADVTAHYRRYYVARNAVVAIVGDLERAQAEAIAARVTGGLAGGERAPALPEVPAPAAAERIDKSHPSTQTHLWMGQPGMRRGDPLYFPLYVGNHVLGGSGLVSRISEEIREKRGLSYSAYSYFSPMAVRGPFVVGLQTRNESTEEALKVARQTLTEFVDNGPSAEELEAAKKNLVGGFALNIDSNSDLVQHLAMIGFYDLPLDYLDRFIDRVEAVTLEQIRAAFRERIHPERMVTVTVGGGA